MSSQAIQNVIQRRREQAGVASLSAHEFRRTAIGDMLDAGIDIATVANFVGHESVETTRRYDRRGRRAVKKAARALHVPYTGRQIGRSAPLQ